MGEWCPIVSGGKVTGFYTCGADFVVIRKEGQIKFVLLAPDTAYDVTPLVRDWKVETDAGTLDVKKLVDPVPTPIGRVVTDVERYVDSLARKLSRYLTGTRVLVDWSAGKDSTASLVVTLTLAERLGFEVFVGYARVPFLERRENERFAEQCARRFGFEVIWLDAEIPAKDVFLERGMPMRGWRWCTSIFKILPLRRLRRRLGAKYEVVGDRLYESWKRLKSLLEYLRQELYVTGNQFKPCFTLTLPDVVDLCRTRAAVHPDYLSGSTRVACAVCPYRPVSEIHEMFDDAADPGFVEHLIRLTYERSEYRRLCSLDEFVRYHLWRYHAEQARKMLSLWRRAERECEEVKLARLKSAISSVWREDLPLLPILSPGVLRWLLETAVAERWCDLIHIRCD